MGKIHGFTKAEIEETERLFGFSIPCVYKAYLTIFGHANGGMLPDGRSTWLTPSQLVDTSDLSEFSRDCGITFPSYLIVVWQHDGYIFNFIDASDNSDDPPVYGWKEGAGTIETISNSFFGYLESSIEWISRRANASQFQLMSWLRNIFRPS